MNPNQNGLIIRFIINNQEPTKLDTICLKIIPEIMYLLKCKLKIIAKSSLHITGFNVIR